jgi:hypothetical protein
MFLHIVSLVTSFVLWYVDLLLGNDHEINNYTASIDK